ncbi:hypothetical protein ABZ069_38205, partial [Streptomyces microflavus]|uniref:hypothetical protein n=1 Tax=Streptomyces microflavus TaxID=1919 RepID=UPI0033A608A8
MSEYSTGWGAGFSGVAPYGGGQGLRLSDALIMAAMGMWAQAAENAGLLMGLQVEEQAFRGAVLQVADGNGLRAPGGDEDTARALVDAGFTELERYQDLLSNPFTGSDPHYIEGWNQDFACLYAIGMGKWDEAESWACWGSGGTDSAHRHILEEALRLTAAHHNLGAAGDSCELAAQLAGLATTTSVLETWSAVLQTAQNRPATQTTTTTAAGMNPVDPDPAWTQHLNHPMQIIDQAPHLGQTVQLTAHQRGIVGAIAVGHLTVTDIAHALNT